MIKKINAYEFVNAFQSSETYKNNFSREGLFALFDYFENLEEETGTPIELDIVAIACEYSEYPTFEAFQLEYPNIKDLEDLNNYTTVIEVDNAMKTESFIIQNF